MAKVSVIMPCYNAARFLPQSVGSVLGQTFSDWELIAVDDGSTDATATILADFGDSRIRVLRQDNKGVSSARNQGISVAEGAYLAFLDADDTWAPSFLQKMHEVLEERPDLVLAYCGWQNVGRSGGESIPFVPPNYETPDKEVTLFAGCRWPIHAVLVRRQAVLDAGMFDQGLSHAEDYALWLRIAARAPIARVPEVLAFYHFHGTTQATANRVANALQQWQAQQTYLRQNPGFKAALGKKRSRTLTLGPILDEAFRNYWKRDIVTARALFRFVMKRGYGSARDWLYMLPALLPLSWHMALLEKRDRGTGGETP